MIIFDIEAYDWINPFILGYYDGQEYNYFKGDGCVAEFFNYLLTHKDIYYAHNGGKYDFMFLLDEYYKRDKEFRKEHKLNMIYSNGRIYNMSISKNKKILFELRDSYPLLPLSLSKLTQDFDVEHKKLDMSMKYFKDYSIQEIIDYNEYDCKGLYEVINKFKDGLNVDKLKLTIASQSQDIMFKMCPILNECKSDKFRDDMIRDGYYGGRVEVFKRYGTNLFYYDINSLYPYVMLNDYPLGYVKRTKTFKDNCLGLYFIHWECPKDLDKPVLPMRFDKLLFCQGKGVGTYYSPEISKAIELGYKIDIKEGFYWEQSAPIFKDYVNKYYTIKKNSEGSPKTISKLMLNSPYGKLAQKLEHKKLLFEKPSETDFNTYDIEVLFADKDIYSRIVMGGNFKRYLPHLAAFVTTYARLELYKYLNDNTYYCDTDSIITDKEIKKTSKEIGGMKLEDKIKEAYFILPKLYAYKSQEPKIRELKFIVPNKFKELKEIDGYKINNGIASKTIITDECIKAKGFRNLTYNTFERAFNNNDVSGFISSWDSIRTFGGCTKENETFLNVVKNVKCLTSNFSKRRLIDKINTKPIILC